jgi:hypothetical protein
MPTHTPVLVPLTSGLKVRANHLGEGEEAHNFTIADQYPE